MLLQTGTEIRRTLALDLGQVFRKTALSGSMSLCGGTSYCSSHVVGTLGVTARKLPPSTPIPKLPAPCQVPSWGQMGRGTEVQGQAAGPVGGICWGLRGEEMAA